MLRCRSMSSRGGPGSRSLCAAALFCLLLPACTEKKAPPPPPPPKVTVARPQRREVADYLELNGTSRAVRSVQLVARVPGYLERVLFRDGQLVSSGQPLFLIQQDTVLARLAQAKAQIQQQTAQLDYAEKQLARFSGLLKVRAAAQSDLDNWLYQRDAARGNLKNAQAQADLARQDLGYTRVLAPFAGRIDRRLKDSGNLVGAGENTVLAELDQVDPIYVYFSIGDLDLSRLRESAHGIPGRQGVASWPMAAGLPGEEGYPHAGRLDFAANSLSDGTGTLLMRAVVENRSGAILPGLQTRVRVPLASRVAFLVPETAVGSDQQGAFLLLVDGKNLVERRPVRTGALIGHQRVIEEGVHGGEWVVVTGLLRAAPGRPVTPEREGEAAAPTASDAPAGAGKVLP